MQPTPRATKRTSAQSNHPICALKSSSTSPTALWLVTHKQIPHSLNRYSSADETAVCNLASLNLQKFIACAQVQCQPCSARQAHIDLVQQAPGSRPYFDFERLVTDHVFVFFSRFSQPTFPILQVEVTRVVTRNLNAVIDVNYYPVSPHSPTSPNELHAFFLFDF
jgi:hypothetical protein